MKKILMWSFIVSLLWANVDWAMEQDFREPAKENEEDKPQKRSLEEPEEEGQGKKQKTQETGVLYEVYIPQVPQVTQESSEEIKKLAEKNQRLAAAYKELLGDMSPIRDMLADFQTTLNDMQQNNQPIQVPYMTAKTFGELVGLKLYWSGNVDSITISDLIELFKVVNLLEMQEAQEILIITLEYWLNDPAILNYLYEHPEEINKYPQTVLKFIGELISKPIILAQRSSIFDSLSDDAKEEQIKRFNDAIYQIRSKLPYVDDPLRYLLSPNGNDLLLTIPTNLSMFIWKDFPYGPGAHIADNVKGKGIFSHDGKSLIYFNVEGPKGPNRTGKLYIVPLSDLEHIANYKKVDILNEPNLEMYFAISSNDQYILYAGKGTLYLLDWNLRKVKKFWEDASSDIRSFSFNPTDPESGVFVIYKDKTYKFFLFINSEGKFKFRQLNISVEEFFKVNFTLDGKNLIIVTRKNYFIYNIQKKSIVASFDNKQKSANFNLVQLANYILLEVDMSGFLNATMLERTYLVLDAHSFNALDIIKIKADSVAVKPNTDELLYNMTNKLVLKSVRLTLDQYILTKIRKTLGLDKDAQLPAYWDNVRKNIAELYKQ